MSNPHKPKVTDDVSGIEVENQRYLDYEQGAKEERERLLLLIDTKKDLVHDGYHGYASQRPCPTCKGCQIEQALKEE